jgi:hypothetical protein
MLQHIVEDKLFPFRRHVLHTTTCDETLDLTHARCLLIAVIMDDGRVGG